MSTIQMSSRRSCWCVRTISRNRRRTRLRTTALPRRRLTTKPARGAPEPFTGRAPSRINLPHLVRPSHFTRSKSESRVSRRVFGKESEDTSGISVSIEQRAAYSRFSVRQKSSHKSARGKTPCKQTMRPDYGVGDVVTLILVFDCVLVSVSVSVLVSGDGDSFTIVVLLSFFSAGGFVTVVSFCSHAANSASPVSRQMYFFIQRNRFSKPIQP